MIMVIMCNSAGYSDVYKRWKHRDQWRTILLSHDTLVRDPKEKCVVKLIVSRAYSPQQIEEDELMRRAGRW